MEKISFLDILIQSWRLSLARKSFLFFGFLIALPVASQFFLPFSENTLDTEALWQLIIASPFTAFVLFCLSLLLNISGTGALITLLFSELRPTIPKQIFTLSSFWSATKKTFYLDSFFGLLFIPIIFLVGLPSLISLLLFTEISQTLILLSTVVFIFIAALTLFTYEFSLFYFLLSPLKLVTAIERGYLLFHKQHSPSLLFGLFSLLILITFTFSVNLVMLGGVVLFQGIFQNIFSESIVFFLISLCFLTWFAVFSQTLWLSFFVRLVSPKDPSLPESDEVLIKESIPEAPVA